MNRLLAAAWLALLVPALVHAGADDDRAAHMRAARAALARGDEASARPHLVAVDSIVGGHAGALRALAAIDARRGDARGALRALRDFAAMGVAGSVRGDSSFATLVGQPEFEALAARIDSGAAPRSGATIAAKLGDAALLAEDLAWDARHRRWLVSSIHRRKIVAVGAEGRVTDFVAGARHGLWGVYALALDAARDRLWATTAAGPEVEGYDTADSGRTALVALALRDGALLERVELPRDGEPHVLGDITLGADGRVYLTDSRGGGVYRFRPGAAAFDTLAPGGTFASPQAPVLTPDGRRIVVPDYPRGLAALDLSSGAVTWLPKPRWLSTGGIDGFVRAGRRWIAIQNGITPHRVVELELDDAATRIEGWRVLEQGSEWMGEPNHGAVVGDDFVFIGNSGWDRVGDDGRLQTEPADIAPVLLRVALPRGTAPR